MTQIGHRIKKYRELRNFTQEYMADKLDISQNSYSRIENDQVKLSTDRLKAISEILDITQENLLKEDSHTFNLNNPTIDKFYGHIENIYEENKELLIKQMSLYEKQLTHLQGENDRLLRLVEKMVGK